MENIPKVPSEKTFLQKTKDAVVAIGHGIVSTAELIAAYVGWHFR